MSELAILGGKKTRSEPFPWYNTMGEEERLAVDQVMRTGILSKFHGSWNDKFLGGPEIRAFEAEWCKRFDAKHSVSVNSNTSGLQAALGAINVGWGDEVIVSPYTMCVSATAPLVWNATPVFADIEPRTYNLDPESIRRKITSKTRAIVVVHIFGCPADMDPILEIAREYKLKVIEDCAQAPGATYKGRQVGTIGDIGVFSLNWHKHIHAGEGGVCTTNDDHLAERLQLIRNHAEAVVEFMRPGTEIPLENLIGFNFRMLELQAAIARVQIKRLDPEIALRRKYARLMEETLRRYPFMTVPEVPSDREHVYYTQAFQYDAAKAGVSRARFAAALRAELAPFQCFEDEGVAIGEGYIKPLYLMPLFQKRIAYKGGFPFTGRENYDRGICPVVEKMHFGTLMHHGFIKGSLSESDFKDVLAAFAKVCDRIGELKE